MPKYYALLKDRELGFDITQVEGHISVVPVFDNSPAGDPLTVDIAPVHANIATGEGLYSILADNKSYQLYIEKYKDHFRVQIWRHRFEIRILTEREWRLMKVAPKHGAAGGPRVVDAPMPGLVKAVIVLEGDTVAEGGRLVVLEAMKMENEIVAPGPGKIKTVHVAAGQVVEAGKPLVTLE